MRVKLNFPEPIIFSTKIKITVADINYGGHMGNDRFLTLMQEARLQWLKASGFENEQSIEPPVGIIVADAAIQYKAEVFHGEVLIVALAVENISTKTFDLAYRLQKEDGSVAALGKTGILCFDYEARKISLIPASLLAKLTPA